MKRRSKIIDRLKKESATKLASEYGIGNSTITGLKKNADKIHSFQTKMDSLSVNKKRKVMRLAKDEDVDEAVYWFEQKRSEGIPMS